jgi:hypothetical protein
VTLGNFVNKCENHCTLLWRPCSFTPIHSLTGPVGQPFASCLEGPTVCVPGMHPHLRWNLFLRLHCHCRGTVGNLSTEHLGNNLGMQKGYWRTFGQLLRDSPFLFYHLPKVLHYLIGIFFSVPSDLFLLAA